MQKMPSILPSDLPDMPVPQGKRAVMQEFVTSRYGATPVQNIQGGGRLILTVYDTGGDGAAVRFPGNFSGSALGSVEMVSLKIDMIAAIDDQGMTGDRAGIIRCQENHGRRYLGGLCDPLERMLTYNGIHHILIRNV